MEYRPLLRSYIATAGGSSAVKCVALPHPFLKLGQLEGTVTLTTKVLFRGITVVSEVMGFCRMREFRVLGKGQKFSSGLRERFPL
jgi:hypothetical protein